MTTTTVPFSPVPGHIAPMRFRPDDDWTYDATPLRTLCQAAYRDAAHAVLRGNESAARRHAAEGNAMELAYMTRSYEEARAAQ